MRGVFFTISLFLTTSAIAKTVYSSKDNHVGNWSETSSWNGTVPSYDIKDNTVTINGTITANNNVSIENKGLLIVKDTLVINGDLTTKNNAAVTIENGAVLIVFGSVVMEKITVAVSGKIVVFENFKLNHSGIGIEIAPETNIYVFGAVDDKKFSFPHEIGSFESFLSGEPDLTDWLDSNYDTALPIELTQFTANVEPHGITFLWTTASETNNDFFTLEYATNGVDFNAITTIAGMGTSTVQTKYEFFDNSPQYEGVTYFRLKQTDFDGAFTYSPIISLEVERQDENIPIVLYPNPTTDNITIDSKNQRITNIRFFDAQNKHIYLTPLSATTYDVSTLPAGIYYVEIYTETTRTVEKIVKK
ncbi:MAG: T9SS type A sorting domain-containing protein [Bacteroidales bacterium]|nr:T9SS type A sorting domain-containing protein [Bacteroidales bacterium]